MGARELVAAGWWLLKSQLFGTNRFGFPFEQRYANVLNGMALIVLQEGIVKAVLAHFSFIFQWRMVRSVYTKSRAPRSSVPPSTSNDHPPPHGRPHGRSRRPRDGSAES